VACVLQTDFCCIWTYLYSIWTPPGVHRIQVESMDVHTIVTKTGNKKRKAEVAETANTLFTFDNDTGPSSKLKKRKTHRRRNLKTLSYVIQILFKIAITSNIFDRDPLPFQLNVSLLLLKPFVKRCAHYESSCVSGKTEEPSSKKDRGIKFPFLFWSWSWNRL
jgi:hypothetical protein